MLTIPKTKKLGNCLHPVYVTPGIGYLDVRWLRTLQRGRVLQRQEDNGATAGQLQPQDDFDEREKA